MKYEKSINETKYPQPKLKLMLNSFSFFDDAESKKEKTVKEEIDQWENDGGSNLIQLSNEEIKKYAKKKKTT